MLNLLAALATDHKCYIAAAVHQYLVLLQRLLPSLQWLGTNVVTKPNISIVANKLGFMVVLHTTTNAH
jgi:hypothetical protein